eukprot:SAG22_NODE_280_length_13084_cov_3.480209_3_plen_108_part_00
MYTLFLNDGRNPKFEFANTIQSYCVGAWPCRRIFGPLREHETTRSFSKGAKPKGEGEGRKKRKTRTAGPGGNSYYDGRALNDKEFMRDVPPSDNHGIVGIRGNQAAD